MLDGSRRFSCQHCPRGIISALLVDVQEVRLENKSSLDLVLLGKWLDL